MIEVDNITDVTLARLSKIRKNIRLLAFLITTDFQQQQHKLYLHDYNYVVTVLQKL